MWITADFRLYPPVITANQELVSPTGDHRYDDGCVVVTSNMRAARPSRPSGSLPMLKLMLCWCLLLCCWSAAVCLVCCCVLCAVLCCVIFEFAGGLLLGMQGYAGAPQKITRNHPGKTM